MLVTLRIKKILLLFSLTTSLLSNDKITLENLNTKEKSYEKDFYIYLYLKQDNITPQNSIDALGQATFVSKDMFNEYAVKIAHDETLAVAQCMNASAKELLYTNSDCIKAGLTIKKSFDLTPLEIDQVINKVKESYPLFVKELQILNAPIPFSKLVSSNKETIYNIYLNSPNRFLFEKLNYKLPSRTIEKIKDDKKFENLLRKIVTNINMNYAQSSFFEFDDSNYSNEVSFLLALNRILNKKIDDTTFNYLDNAYLKSTKQISKDKILFWKFQVKKDEKYLNSLLESNDLNIYTIFAKQYFNQEFYPFNVEYDNPHDELLSDFSVERRVLLNSFMKEDSKFDTTLISKNFTIGLFQINYIEASKIAKYKNLDFKSDTLFNPSKNICFFSHYLNKLESEFYHPLFIMYAKKDGIKNLKSNMKNGLFQINSSFEPYLSMELYPNDIVKEYVKSVLKNYTVYFENINNKNLRLEDFFKNLNEPLNLLDF